VHYLNCAAPGLPTAAYLSRSLADVAVGFPWISALLRHATRTRQIAICNVHYSHYSMQRASRSAPCIPGKAQRNACNVHHATYMQRTTSRCVTDMPHTGMQHAQTCTMRHAPHRIRQPRRFLWISGTLMGICVLLVNRHEPVSVDASSLKGLCLVQCCGNGRAGVRARVARSHRRSAT